jgi:hypothetical protein
MANDAFPKTPSIAAVTHAKRVRSAAAEISASRKPMLTVEKEFHALKDASARAAAGVCQKPKLIAEMVIHAGPEKHVRKTTNDVSRLAAWIVERIVAARIQNAQRVAVVLHRTQLIAARASDATRDRNVPLVGGV